MDIGILSAIGKTPAIRFDRLFYGSDLEVFGKIEALNPGGSVKDRPACRILEEAIRSGQVTPDTVVIESSSGNMGVGLAQACRFFGLRFICVVDSKAAPQNLKVLSAYGAEIELVTDPDPETGELLQARLTRVRDLLERIPGSFWPNQYANENNSRAHYATTMEEIVEQVGAPIDFLFVATSTCGTMHGCGRFIKDHDLSTRLVAVDALGSLIFSDRPGPRMIPGLGAGLTPPLCDLSLVHETVHVSDRDCILGCRLLMETEAFLAGGSSGGVVAALSRFKDRIPAGSRCVLLLCDRGERYLDTIYNDEWVREHCGGLPAWRHGSPERESIRHAWETVLA